MKEQTLKLCICGHFAFGQQRTNGQTVKTANLYEALQSRFDVVPIDTYHWKRHPFRLLFRLMAAERHCDAIIMLPAHNGVRVFSRLFVTLNKVFRKRLFYDVIGGWLPELTVRYPRMAACLKRFDGIWVETTAMEQALVQQGFSNITVVPNFKDLRILTPQELTYSIDKPYRLCTFSRVMKEKGIEDAVAAVRTVNEKQGETVFSLDIYGPVDEHYRERFDSLQAAFPDYIRYRGTVPAAESVETLRPYFALLFPTYYEGEGLAGTIIDAMASGVPVISSDWRYNTEIIAEGINGLIFKTHNQKSLEKRLLYASENVEAVNNMRKKCLEAAEHYTKATFEQKVLSILLNV